MGLLRSVRWWYVPSHEPNGLNIFLTFHAEVYHGMGEHYALIPQAIYKMQMLVSSPHRP